MALNYTLAQQVAKLKEARDNLIYEFALHTAEKLEGRERVNYTLNGRTYDWVGYEKNAREAIKDLNDLIKMTQPAIAVGVLR